MIKFILIFLLLSMAGCTVHEKANYLDFVKRVSQEVEPLDGFDKREAVLWAQYLTIREGIHEELSSLEPVKVQKKIFWIKDGQVFYFDVAPSRSAGFKKYETWRVYFSQERDLTHPVYIEFDARTGELMNIGLTKK